MPRESGTRHRLRARSEKFDEPLLPLHPSKGEVVVARPSSQAYNGHGVWAHMAKLPPDPAAGLAVLARSVDCMQSVAAASESIEDFFARYTGYLTAGDIEGLAAVYNYPSLAVTAMGCLAITDPQQSRDFFGQGQHFYRSRGIHSVRARDIVTDVEVPGIWVGRLVLENLDDTGRPTGLERNAYQVVTGPRTERAASPCQPRSTRTRSRSSGGRTGPDNSAAHTPSSRPRRRRMKTTQVTRQHTT